MAELTSSHEPTAERADDPLSPFVRPHVRAVPPAVHGALSDGELRRWGRRPEEVLDFSANVNPYGPPPGVEGAWVTADVARYPDPDALRLREALADHHGVRPEHIVVTNGTAELIWLVALAFVRPGDRVLVCAPTYGDYARAVRLMGGSVAECRAREEDGFAHRAAHVEEALRRLNPRLCFICTPNNPTGRIVPANLIWRWADTFPHTLFAVDEAYINFVPGLLPAVDPARPNVLVLRSMTKDYALAGLRVGYGVGHAGLIGGVARVRPSWNVSAVAQAAGLAALAGRAHMELTVREVRRASAALREELGAVGLEVLPSSTHFFLVRVGRARAFRDALARQGIAVRDCTSFGLPAHVRVSARRPEENRRLVEAVRAVLRGRRP